MGSAQPFPDSLLPLNAVSDCISCAANALVVYRLKEVCNTWRELSVSIPSVHINGSCSADAYLLQRYMKCVLTFLHMDSFIYLFIFWLGVIQVSIFFPPENHYFNLVYFSFVLFYFNCGCTYIKILADAKKRSSHFSITTVIDCLDYSVTLLLLEHDFYSVRGRWERNVWWIMLQHLYS